jgi:hypothetical protein
VRVDEGEGRATWHALARIGTIFIWLGKEHRESGEVSFGCRLLNIPQRLLSGINFFLFLFYFYFLVCFFTTQEHPEAGAYDISKSNYLPSVQYYVLPVFYIAMLWTLW